jgi:hypothetical protein
MRYAKGSKAYGFCDRTGFRYPLAELVDEYRNGTRTGARVGKDVVDPDHPQNFIGRVRTDDAISLRDPRPDTATGRGLWGWNPVGNPGNVITLTVGRVTVQTT